MLKDKLILLRTRAFISYASKLCPYFTRRIYTETYLLFLSHKMGEPVEKSRHRGDPVGKYNLGPKTVS